MRDLSLARWRRQALHGPQVESLLAAIGNTPLLELDPGPEAAPGARLFAKLESVNPGGSIKDRPVARMLCRALADGRFEEGRRLLDSSSGNAGIAYAQLGAALGIGVTLVATREDVVHLRHFRVDEPSG